MRGSLFQRARSYLGTYLPVLRNVSWLGLSGVLVKPVWFVFIAVLCVRYLGDSGYGLMMTALSLAYLTFSFASLGLETLMVREVASDRSRASLYYTNFLALRIVLTSVAALVALGSGIVLGYEPELMKAVLFASVYLLALSLTQYGHKFFQAFERLRYQAFSEMLEKLFVVTAGTVLLITTASPHWTLGGMAVGMMATVVVTQFWVLRHFASLKLELLDLTFIGRSLRVTLPFALTSIFSTFHFRVDTVMVEAMLDATAAGHYGLPFRLVEGLGMLSILVTYAVYPRLSRLSTDGSLRDFAHLTLLGTLGLAAISTIVAAGVFFFSQEIILIISSDVSFEPSIAALRRLVWAFPLVCVMNMLNVALLALHQQRFTALAFAIATAANISVNLVLIPLYGIDGAAVATVLTNAILVALFISRLLHERSRSTGHVTF